MLCIQKKGCQFCFIMIVFAYETPSKIKLFISIKQFFYSLTSTFIIFI